MKKVLILFLTLVLVAVPVFGSSNLVSDGEGLLTYEEAAKLESLYAAYSEFTPVLVTVDSFSGLSAAKFAGRVYDQMDYPYDGILYLVSLTEGEWYILTNGVCHDRITDWDAQEMGEILVDNLRGGEYYEAFTQFPELAARYFAPSHENALTAPVTTGKNYGKTIGISMAVGMLIGLIAVGIMASKMKTVRSQSGASEYVRSGSMHLTHSRDIFLYSHVHRTPKPKSNSSGGSHGGSRGGAGGRI